MRFLFVLAILISTSAFAQMELVPLPKREATTNARISATTPKKLPFWDDFSFAKGSVPADTLWEFGKSVWVNNGIGINPPSLGVATFDGLDSLGKPYNATDVLAKGFADRITSQPIQLNLVEASQRFTVYISFYYQFKGQGEAPDTGDMLRLLFLTKTGTWETVWSIENTGNLDPSVFNQVILPVPVNDDRFFHDKFRFRFQNFARLSGPFDTWNLDYVYLNQGRSATDTSYPDRTLVSPLTSIFNEYYSIPLKHFLKDPAVLMQPARFTMHNLRVDNNQPMNYYSYARIRNIDLGNVNSQDLTLDTKETVGAVNALEYKTSPIKTLPPVTSFLEDSDTILIDLKLGLSSGDNVPVSNSGGGGDYDVTKFGPIDFRWNDTTSTHYHLSNYYAYDDGSAEYGAGLNQPGAQLAYRFDMKTASPDTLVGVQIYFPRFGDETSRVIQLQILKDLNGTLGSTLYSETVTVQRSEHDEFPKMYVLNRFVGVQGQFYVGWKQNTASVIPVGLDKNGDSSTKMFFNTSGIWEQNGNLKGNLMIRPVFGKGGATVGLNEVLTAIRSYPNPNSGIFFVPSSAQSIRLFDAHGRAVFFNEEFQRDRTQISVAGAGLFIVQYYLDQKLVSEKIIVRE